MDRSARGWWLDGVWVLTFALLSSCWCLAAGARLSATYDETTYLRLGLEGWRTGEVGLLLRLGTMPLPVNVQTLPLSLAERWRGSPFDLDADFAGLLQAARAANLVFWWLLLAVVWRAGRGLGGPWGGRLAVAFVACEPSLLAHASLATTDLAVAAGVLGLLAHYRARREARWRSRVGLTALWLAVATLTKASGLVFGVIGLLAVEFEGRWRAARAAGVTGWRPLLSALWAGRTGAPPLGRDLAQVVALSVGLTFLYCGTDWRPIDSLVAWAHSLPTGPGADLAVRAAEAFRLFPNAGYAFARQVSHNVRGHGVFLLGQTDRRALWYYFPVLLAIKLTLPLLLLPVLTALCRRRASFNWAWAAALALLAFSALCRVQIGVRFMLPLVALLAVGLAGALGAWLVEARLRGRVVLALLLTLAVGWSGAGAARCWPHGLAYINEAWGGPEQGHRLVHDSNFDWGQGLADLREWQAQQGGELFVWYFGGDPAVNGRPFRPVRLHELPRTKEPWPEVTLDDLAGQRLAVSATFLAYPPESVAMREDQRYLRSLTPVGRTLTYFVYDIPDRSGPGDPAGRVTAGVSH